MKKLLLKTLVLCCLCGEYLYAVNTDTVQVNSYPEAMDWVYGNLDTAKLNTGLLINRAPVDSTFFSFNGKEDSALYYPLFLLHYSHFQIAKNEPANQNTFLLIDSAARAKPYIPIGVCYYQYDKISDAAVYSGKLQMQNGRFSTTDAAVQPFQKATYFSVCPMTFGIAQQAIFRLDSDFIFSNQQWNNGIFMADFNDGLGKQILNLNQDYTLTVNSELTLLNFYFIANGDTLRSSCKLFSFPLDSVQTEAKLGFPCEYESADIAAAPLLADTLYGLIKSGLPTGRFAVWLGCGNDTNGSNPNTLRDIRKPYIVSGGFNPLNGKKLDPCTLSDFADPNILHMMLQYQLISAIVGVTHTLSSGILPPIVSELLLFIYQTNLYGGWRGPIYETYNGCYNKYFSPSDPKNGNNGSNYFRRLREEGYDVIIVTYDNPTDYIENNAAVLISLIKKINEQLPKNGSKHELIVGGYSAGAITSRIALAKMEKEYVSHKGQSNASNFPHPHTRLYMSIEGEFQGANTPLGFQHLVDYLCKDIANTPLEIVEIMLANLTRKQFSNATAKELSVWHYQATNNGYMAKEHPDRTNLVSLQNLLGYPHFCRNVGISQGNGHGLKYTGINPPAPMFSIRANVEAGCMPFLSIGYFRQYHAYYTPLTSGYANLVDRKKGILLSYFNYSCYINLLSSYNNQHIYFTNSKPFDECPGSLLSADRTFGDAGASYLFGTLSQIISPLSLNYYSHQGSDHSFAPTVSALDMKDASTGHNADLFYNLKSNNLLAINKINGILQKGIHEDYGYPHIAYPTNHYSITPFDAIWAVGLNSKADNHYHVEDPQPYMAEFMAAEVAPEHVFLSNRTIDEELPVYAYLNANTGFQVNTTKYQAAFDARRKIYCGFDVYHIPVYPSNGTAAEVKELTPNGNFTIGANADVEFTAGEDISLLPGFEVTNGASFNAQIIPKYCINTWESSRMNNSPESISYSSNGNTVTKNSSSQQIHVISGKETEYSILPNPADDKIQIHGISPEETLSVTLYDMYGKIQKIAQITADQNALSTLELKNGMYLLELKNHQNIFLAKKLIIQHE